MNIRFTAILFSYGLSLLYKDVSASVRGAISTNPLLCQVSIVDGMNEPSLLLPVHEDDQEFRCHLKNDTIPYSLDLPQDFVRKHPHVGNNGLVSISGARPVFDRASMKPPFISIPANATISMVYPSDADSQHRHLQSRPSKTHGNKTILVLLVTSPDGQVELSKEQLSERIFAIGDNVPRRTVTGQYSDCSYGQLKFLPAQGNGVVNGVAEITIAFNVTEVDPSFLEVVVAEQAEADLGIASGTLDDNFDHIMFVLPRGSRRMYSIKWIAYAYIGRKRSIFNNINAGYLTVVMHELGHNFGLQHSSEHRNPYGDKSGIMGASFASIDTPYKCFNGHKNYLLGWYADKTITVNVTEGSWVGTIAGLTNYDVIRPEDYMIVNVGDLYLQFNRANKFNLFTHDDPNQITIVRGPAPNAQSELLGSVSQVNKYLFPTVHRIENFQVMGSDLVIEACEQKYLSRISTDLPDIIRVSIYLDDGVQSSSCNEPTPSPSKVPSNRPSAVPTTSSPSFEPSSSPSAAPSGSPTLDCAGMDQPGLIPVSHQLGNKTCQWIANNPTWKTFLCQEGYEAFEQCQETCGSCNAKVAEMSSSDTCEDSRKIFYVNEHLGNRRCFWVNRFLERNPKWKDRVCAPDQEAYSRCPETCGKCSDACEDQPDATFYVNRRQGWQNCEWLAKRPIWQAMLCIEGHNAYKYCNELCDTCL